MTDPTPLDRPTTDADMIPVPRWALELALGSSLAHLSVSRGDPDLFRASEVIEAALEGPVTPSAADPFQQMADAGFVATMLERIGGEWSASLTSTSLSDWNFYQGTGSSAAAAVADALNKPGEPPQ